MSTGKLLLATCCCAAMTGSAVAQISGHGAGNWAIEIPETRFVPYATARYGASWHPDGSLVHVIDNQRIASTLAACSVLTALFRGRLRVLMIPPHSDGGDDIRILRKSNHLTAPFWPQNQLLSPPCSSADSVFIAAPSHYGGEPSQQPKENPGVNWDDNWHKVKVIRRGALIQVFVDDMAKPCMSVEDETFLSGGFGIGSFNNFGDWDDVKIWGKKVED